MSTVYSLSNIATNMSTVYWLSNIATNMSTVYSLPNIATNMSTVYWRLNILRVQGSFKSNLSREMYTFYSMILSKDKEILMQNTYQKFTLLFQSLFQFS